MRKRIRRFSVLELLGFVLLLGTAGAASAQDSKSPYPNMAPVEQYRSASTSEEIALSRSAAPVSISGDASVMTLGDHGYVTALKGKNGFVCMVQRAWASNFDDAGFWNPKLRGPICFNAAAARTILPPYLERTQWALAGVSKADMLTRTQTEREAKHIAEPEAGALAYMMSKQGYLGDSAGHWHPHLMFFFTHAAAGDWGADQHGSPVFASLSETEPLTTFFVLVPTWSDGSPAEAH